LARASTTPVGSNRWPKAASRAALGPVRIARAALAYHLELARPDLDDGVARLAPPRLGEGHIEGLGRLAAGQGGGGAVGLGPGAVEGQDLARLPHQGGRLGHGVQQFNRHVAGRLDRLGPAETEQGDQGDQPHGDDQDQARGRGRIGPKGRIGQGGDRRHRPESHHGREQVERKTAVGRHAASRISRLIIR